MAKDEQSLSEAAEGALEGDPQQERLDGTDYSRVTFNGMAWDAVDVPDLKEEVEFIVKGIVVEEGNKVYKDGEIRPIAKVDVQGVRRVKAGTFSDLKERDQIAE